MSEEKRAWTYARVLNNQAEELLEYQMNKCVDYIQSMNWLWLGSSHDICDGYSLNQPGIQRMLSSITNEYVDVIVAYSPLRILVTEDLYEEFEMLCNMHHVQIITLKK